MLDLTRKLLFELCDEFVSALFLRLNLILYHLILLRELVHLEASYIFDEIAEVAEWCVNILFSASNNAWNHEHLFDLVVNFLEVFFLLDTVVLERVAKVDQAANLSVNAPNLTIPDLKRGLHTLDQVTQIGHLVRD